MPRLPRQSMAAPMVYFKSKPTQPSPRMIGVANIHFWRMATARSREINTPRNPETMSGPWVRARDGNVGKAQPMRSSPAHIASRRARMAMAMNGMMRTWSFISLL